jgi:hypothetical protein
MTNLRTGPWIGITVLMTVAALLLAVAITLMMAGGGA